MPDLSYGTEDPALRRRVRFWRAWALAASAMLVLTVVLMLAVAPGWQWRLWFWNMTHQSLPAQRTVVPQ